LVRAYRGDVRLGLHALQTPAALQAVLQQAGLTDMQVTGEEVDFVYADEEEWWAMMRSGGPGASLERMPSETLTRCKADVFAMLQAFKHPDGLHHARRVLYTVAVARG
jgi:hypothetical protein